MLPQNARKWRSAHSLLEEWAEWESQEWHRITGGSQVVKDWPPRMKSLRRVDRP